MSFYDIIFSMRRGLLTFLIVAGILVLCQLDFVCANELTDDYYDIATNYFNSNNYAKALEYLDSVLNIEPDNLPALTLKNKILPLCGVQTQTEVQETAKAISEVPDVEKFTVLDIPQADIEKMNYDSDYYNTKGQELYQKQDYNTAIEYFFKAIKVNSSNAQAYNNLAMSYWMKNNPKFAIKYFKKAHAKNKCYTQPLVNLSLLYKQLGKEEKRFYYLQKALKYNPNDYWAYYLLGEYYKEKNCYTKAIENFKEAVTINNKFSQAYMELAISFFEIEEFQYSLLALNRYLELNPDSDFALFMMARANLVLCNYDLAKSEIEMAIKICNKPEYRYELGKIEYYLEHYDVALDIFLSLIQNDSFAEVFNYVGLCNYKLKNIDIAVANFNKAVELDGLRPIYYYNLAQCYKSMGDKKNYLKNMNGATKINPINYQDFIDLSYIYYDNGNPNYAINTLNSAISKYPGVKALYLSKLKIYEAIGDTLNYNDVKDLINERFNTK